MWNIVEMSKTADMINKWPRKVTFKEYLRKGGGS
jgi:hypothetical protein